MSREDLARAIGVTRKTIYNWERAGRIPQSAVEKMTKLFNCTADYLLGREAS